MPYRIPPHGFAGCFLATRVDGILGSGSVCPLDEGAIIIGMLDQPKISQIAAFFIQRAGGQINVLKLTKLLYLAEREAMAKHGSMMAGDSPVSLPEGPVLTRALNLTNGIQDSVPNGWNRWVSDRAAYEVALNEEVVGFTRDALDRLSDAEICILDRVWVNFGKMSKYEIRDWTHKHCGEWEDPNGSSLPIPFERIFKNLGFSKEQSKAMAAEEISERHIDQVLASL